MANPTPPKTESDETSPAHAQAGTETNVAACNESKGVQVAWGKRLSTKLALGMGLVGILVGAVMWAALVATRLHDADQADIAFQHKQAHTAGRFLENQQERLQALATDWAHWDDAYAFMIDRNQAFIDSTFSGTISEDLDIELAAMYDMDGKLVHAHMPEEAKQHAQAFEKLFVLYPSLIGVGTAASEATPVLQLSGTRWLLASEPVLRTDNTGPSNGHIVFAKAIDEDLTEAVSRDSSNEVAFTPDFPNSAKPTGDGGWITFGNKQITVYEPVTDMGGKNTFWMGVTGPRLFRENAMASLGENALASLAMTIALVAGMWGMLRVLLSKRLKTLLDQLHHIDEHPDTHTPIVLNGQDELAVLAQTLDHTLERLIKTQKERDQMQAKLLDASRLAGRADVASDVLHRVGNLLGTTTVAAEQIRQLIQHSAGKQLSASANLLKEQTNLADFFRDDARAQHLPELLDAIGQRLAKERDIQNGELMTLLDHIDQIQQVIAQQEIHVHPEQLNHGLPDGIDVLPPEHWAGNNI